MALKIEKSRSIFQKTWLCWLALTNSTEFKRLEDDDNREINSTRSVDERARIEHLRNAYGSACRLMLMGCVAGGLVGMLLHWTIGTANGSVIALVQVPAAGAVLWATLAMVGWPIASFASVTLTELVNQWIYRFVSALGTALFVAAETWGIPG